MRSSRDDSSDKDTNSLETGKFRFINTKSFQRNPLPLTSYKKKIYDTSINNNYENNINNVDNQQSNVTNNICIIIKNAEKQKSKLIDKISSENNNNNNPIYNYPNYNRSMNYINYTKYNNTEDLNDDKQNNYCDIDSNSDNENKTSLRKTLHQKQKELHNLKNKIEYKQIVINNKKSIMKNKLYDLGYCNSNVNNRQRNNHSINYKNNSMNLSNKKRPVSFVRSIKNNEINYLNNSDINARKKSEIKNLKSKIIENFNENKNNKIPIPSIDMFNDIPMTNLHTCKYTTNDFEDEKEKLNNSFNIIELGKNNENGYGIKFNQSIKNKRELLGIPLNNNESKKMNEKIAEEMANQTIQEIDKKVAMYKQKQEEILKNYEKQKLMQQKIRQEMRGNNKSKEKTRSQNNSFVSQKKIHNTNNKVNFCKNKNMKKSHILNKSCDAECENRKMKNKMHINHSYYRTENNDNSNNINYNRNHKNRSFITGDNCSEFDLGDNYNYNNTNYKNTNYNNYINSSNNHYNYSNKCNNNYNYQYNKNNNINNKTSHNTHHSNNLYDRYLHTNDNYNNNFSNNSNYNQSDHEQSDNDENNNSIRDYNYVNYDYNNYNNYNNNNKNYYRNNNYLNINRSDYFINNNSNYQNEYSFNNYNINNNPRNYNNYEKVNFNNPNKSNVSTISSNPNISERYNTNIKFSPSIEMPNINNSNYSNYLYTEDSEKQKNFPKKTYENNAPQKNKTNNKMQNNPINIKQVISTKECGKMLAIKNYEDGKTIRLIKKRKKNCPISIQNYNKPMVNVSMSSNLINSFKTELNETKNNEGVNNQISAIRRINMKIQNYKNKNKITLMIKRKKFDKKPQNDSYLSLTNNNNDNYKKSDKAILKNKSIRTLPDQNKKNIFEASFGSKY